MNPSRKSCWSACLGNLFEHYDTALFGFLSPFLAPLMFPAQDPLTALILTYAIFPLSMLARPLGALVFGCIGDAYDRERALFFTLAGMALISGLIALSPTYAQAGILVPIFFCFGRALQNFFAAGETMGGAIFILERAPEKRYDILSGLYSMSAIGGHLLASWGVYALSQYSSINPGWRLLYLFGCITALFGCMIRRVPSHPYTNMRPTIAGLKNTLLLNFKPLVILILNAGFAYATYSMALVLMNGLLPLVSSITKAEAMKINSYLLILDVCALPLFGYAASKISREKLMLCVALATVCLAIPLMMALPNASFACIIAIRVVLVLLGVAFFAPFHAFAQTLVPAHCRYAVISLGYAIGAQLLGSPTAAISLWCFQKTGMIASIGAYWMLLALASSISLIFAMQRKRAHEFN